MENLYKRKIQNLKDLEFYGHYSLASEMVLNWCKEKPNNKELKALSEAMVGIFFWCNQMEQEARIHKQIVSEYDKKRLDAQIKQREAEEKVEELQDEIRKIKQIQEF